MEIKIGRNTYTITVEDRFMDNGYCTQLISQPLIQGKASPRLSKKAIKELKKVGLRRYYGHRWGDNVRIYGIRGEE